MALAMHIGTRATGAVARPEARLRVVRVHSSVQTKEVETKQAAAPAKKPAVIRPHYPGSKVSAFEEVMGFTGAAPEIINGRLAQLGFLAAIGAELFTQKPALAQINGSTIGIIFNTFVLVAIGSLVPILRGIQNDEAFGPFTPAAEMKNGRAAMVGFLALIIVETFKGSALF